jgi:hypothetical protein
MLRTDNGDKEIDIDELIKERNKFVQEIQGIIDAIKELEKL